MLVVVVYCTVLFSFTASIYLHKHKPFPLSLSLSHSLLVCTPCPGALKMYLRELPDPLLTRKMYTEWVKAAG